MAKRQRLLTKRVGDDFEFIEMEEVGERQYLYHRSGDSSFEACFPISVDLVKERFLELGREYRQSGKEFAKKVSDLCHG